MWVTVPHCGVRWRSGKWQPALNICNLYDSWSLFQPSVYLIGYALSICYSSIKDLFRPRYPQYNKVVDWFCILCSSISNQRKDNLTIRQGAEFWVNVVECNRSILLVMNAVMRMHANTNLYWWKTTLSVIFNSLKYM